MKKIIFIVFVLFLLGRNTLYSQTNQEAILLAKDSLKSIEIDPLTPAKAAFYSAILPGLGQAYNKQYWKIPIVYGAMGTSLYFYLDSNKKYNEYRDEYKRRLEGYSNEEYDYLDNDRLIQAQKFYQRNRDISGLITIGLYVLNIVEANVNAHLRQFNVDERLSLRPEIYLNDVTLRPNLGLTLNYNF